jgi:recombination protein RecT
VTTVQTAVAKRNEETPTIGAIIQRLRPEIQRALPKHMDADRMARLALTVLRKDPALASCTPESFAGSLLGAAALGLEPGVNGEAYLVAYKGECTLIVGYQGYAKLFWQHPMAKHLDAQAVHAKDDFDYEYGLDPFLRHKPALGERGDVVAYYAVASLTSGGSAFVVITPDEAKALRGGKVGPSGRIADPMHWMERKTAVRQLVKMLPKSPMLARALDTDERGGHELHRQQVAEATPAPALGSGVDTQTGEVHDGELVDPPADPWGDVNVAQPPLDGA